MVFIAFDASRYGFFQKLHIKKKGTRGQSKDFGIYGHRHDEDVTDRLLAGELDPKMKVILSSTAAASSSHAASACLAMASATAPSAKGGSEDELVSFLMLVMVLLTLYPFMRAMPFPMPSKGMTLLDVTLQTISASFSTRSVST